MGILILILYIIVTLIIGLLIWALPQLIFIINSQQAKINTLQSDVSRLCNAFQNIKKDIYHEG